MVARQSLGLASAEFPVHGELHSDRLTFVPPDPTTLPQSSAFVKNAGKNQEDRITNSTPGSVRQMR